MQYLIDGHNLIPKVPGLSLSDPDDEEQLIERLQGWAGTRHGGPVTAIFVRDGKTADSAIMDELAKLKSAARNVFVVSSDRMVQAAARAAHAKIIKSEDFAVSLFELKSATGATVENPALTPGEIAEWEKFFSSKND